MPVLRTEEAEDYGHALLCVLAHKLNQALISEGIADAGLRERVVGHYLSAMGSFLSRGWLEAGGERVYPLQCFSSTWLDDEQGPEDIDRLYLPPEMMDWANFGVSNCEAYFRQWGERLDGENGVPHGLLSDEDLPDY